MLAEVLSPLVDWLLRPLSGSGEHDIAAPVYWHARLMVLAWAICLPLGAVLARYFKITPWQDWPHVLDNKFWWHGHRALQYLGLLAMALGVYLVYRQAPQGLSPLNWLHQLLGWLVLLLGLVQMLGGLLRGSKGGPTERQLAGDHYDMSRWRRVFEHLHKSLGWLAIGLSCLVIVLGLVCADAPRWMLCVLLAWWLALLAGIVHLQRRGCCIDTYQAIWGPSRDLPGLQRAPIGWGVRRTDRHPWRSPSQHL